MMIYHLMLSALCLPVFARNPIIDRLQSECLRAQGLHQRRRLLRIDLSDKDLRFLVDNVQWTHGRTIDTDRQVSVDYMRQKHEGSVPNALRLYADALSCAAVICDDENSERQARFLEYERKIRLELPKWDNEPVATAPPMSDNSQHQGGGGFMAPLSSPKYHFTKGDRVSVSVNGNRYRHPGIVIERTENGYIVQDTATESRWFDKDEDGMIIPYYFAPEDLSPVAASSDQKGEPVAPPPQYVSRTQPPNSLSDYFQPGRSMPSPPQTQVDYGHYPVEGMPEPHSPRPSVPAKPSSTEEWACPTCTYLNPATNVATCGMCGN